MAVITISRSAGIAVPEGPDLQVDGHRYRAGQATDAGGQVLRRDVAGAGTHGHKRGEVSVVELQLVVHGNDLGLGVAAVRLGKPTGLALVAGYSVEIEFVALDVLHHDARLVVVIGRQ